MAFFFGIISLPFGLIMRGCYHIVPNYGWTLVLFAIITKLMLLPLAIKQQKNSITSAISGLKLKPKLDQLKARCGKNRELYNVELTKLYQEEGINPIDLGASSGCLVSVLQLVIMFGMIGVVYGPLSHILSVSKEAISVAVDVLKDLNGGVLRTRYAELSVMEAVKSNPGLFSGLGKGVVDKIQGFNTTLLGVNFASAPKLGLNVATMLPILTILTQIVSVFQMHKYRVDFNVEPGQKKAMLVAQFLPMLVFAYLYFSMPVGIAFYFMFSNVISMVQTEILNRRYNVQETVKRRLAEDEEEKKKKRAERVLIQKRMDDGADVSLAEKERLLSKRDMNKQKLNDARKHIEEKYGEVVSKEQDDAHKGE
ncbi:MAG: YidC/Oxa1 family membrane protein insertase [Oscillospiraceae bacterium]|jgi:YidC/Oxa1 family membrane protein insertase|nr:YidC/Oxa1 family membrane protein insertase [Oscillospiraceae bacterium]